MNDNQIKHMVDRFLGWTLPEECFTPDCGISYTYNGTRPTGTNLFDTVQTEEMVRYLVEGLAQLPIAPLLNASTEEIDSILATYRYGGNERDAMMNAIDWFVASRNSPQAQEAAQPEPAQNRCWCGMDHVLCLHPMPTQPEQSLAKPPKPKVYGGSANDRLYLCEDVDPILDAAAQREAALRQQVSDLQSEYDAVVALWKNAKECVAFLRIENAAKDKLIVGHRELIEDYLGTIAGKEAQLEDWRLREQLRVKQQ